MIEGLQPVEKLKIAFPGTAEEYIIQLLEKQDKEIAEIKAQLILLASK